MRSGSSLLWVSSQRQELSWLAIAVNMAAVVLFKVGCYTCCCFQLSLLSLKLLTQTAVAGTALTVFVFFAAVVATIPA